MSKRDVIQYLNDMLLNARRAQDLVEHLSFEDLQADWPTQYALLRALEIIGEAARYIPAEVRRQAPEIPWSDIVGMRNLLIHHYHGVDWEIVWETTLESIPELIKALEALLQKLN